MVRISKRGTGTLPSKNQMSVKNYVNGVDSCNAVVGILLTYLTLDFYLRPLATESLVVVNMTADVRQMSMPQ